MVSRIHQDSLLLDMRTVTDRDLPSLARMLDSALTQEDEA